MSERLVAMLEARAARDQAASRRKRISRRIARIGQHYAKHRHPKAAWIALQLCHDNHIPAPRWLIEALHQYIEKVTRGSQSERAQKPRKRIDADTPTSLADLVRTFDASERDGHGDLLPAAELWPHLHSLLDDLGLEPLENVAGKVIAFDGGEIKYTSFTATLRKQRRT